MFGIQALTVITISNNDNKQKAVLKAILKLFFISADVIISTRGPKLIQRAGIQMGQVT